MYSAADHLDWPRTWRKLARKWTRGIRPILYTTTRTSNLSSAHGEHKLLLQQFIRNTFPHTITELMYEILIVCDVLKWKIRVACWFNVSSSSFLFCNHEYYCFIHVYQSRIGTFISYNTVKIQHFIHNVFQIILIIMHCASFYLFLAVIVCQFSPRIWKHNVWLVLCCWFIAFLYEALETNTVMSEGSMSATLSSTAVALNVLLLL